MEWFVPDVLGPWWFAILLFMSFCASAFTAAFGVGGGVALIAVMLMVLPPAVVLPVHGVIQAGSNLGRVWAMREAVRTGILLWFAGGSVVGVTLASLIVVSLPAAWMESLLGAFILWALWAPRPRERHISDRGYALVGAGASFCTMFVGATGVLVGAFWQVARMGKQAVVATHAACMAVQHSFKVVAFALLGFAFLDWLGFIAAMVAVGYVGTLAGKRLLARLPERLFASAFRWLLTALALQLLVSAGWTLLRG